jgi:hypothetical protein
LGEYWEIDSQNVLLVMNKELLPIGSAISPIQGFPRKNTSLKATHHYILIKEKI